MTVLPCFRLCCLGIAYLLLLSGCAAQRVSPPPAGEPLRLHWGAVDTDYTDSASEDIFTEEALRAAADVAREVGVTKLIEDKGMELSTKKITDMVFLKRVIKPKSSTMLVILR